MPRFFNVMLDCLVTLLASMAVCNDLESVKELFSNLAVSSVLLYSHFSKHQRNGQSNWQIAITTATASALHKDMSLIIQV